ncbi:MAG: nodulation protein NfeD [Dehalococcoidia bacterium]|nr:nodulation protein NfeD [Dehalococcoidia bacterium]
MKKRRRKFARSVRLLAAGALMAVALLGFACASSVDTRGAVNVLTAEGTVNPIMARYIDRGIDAAEDADATAVVVRLDTPGGLDTSMRDIVKRFNEAEVPVIVYVWPSGARAASAGTFITMAAHVAAMAPNTTIGAAHPVGAGGEDIEGTLGDKVTNEAAEYIRGIAQLRGRNADWAEDAVRRSIAANENEALEENVIDIVADNLDDLLEQADGLTVRPASGETTVRTVGVPVVHNDMTLIERFLSIISDPNIAFILLSLGMLGVFFELLNPGALFPGVLGAIALLLGFFSLGTLPINWAGVFLIVLAFVLFVAEIAVAGFGILGVGGVISLILGGLLLTSTSNPEFQVSRWLIFGMAAVIGVFFLTTIGALVRARRQPVALGPQTLVGRQAVARSPLDPSGIVFLEGERWTAVSVGGRVEEGETVEVVGMEGIRLRVRPVQKE